MLLKDLCNIVGITTFFIPSFTFFLGEEISLVSSIFLGAGSILTLLSLLRFFRSLEKFHVSDAKLVGSHGSGVMEQTDNIMFIRLFRF